MAASVSHNTIIFCALFTFVFIMFVYQSAESLRGLSFFGENSLYTA